MDFLVCNKRASLENGDHDTGSDTGSDYLNCAFLINLKRELQKE